MSPKQDAFLGQVYHENFRRLVGYAFHWTEDWGKAEVVVQEAFCIAADKIEDLMKSDAPLRWMKATVKNVARNMKRHEGYQKALFLHLEDLESLPQLTSALDGIDTWELCEQIAGKENFQLFKRIALDGVSYLEVAKELHIGVWACRKRVQRTIQALREGLTDFSIDPVQSRSYQYIDIIRRVENGERAKQFYRPICFFEGSKY